MPVGPLDRLVGVRVGALVGALLSALIALIAGMRAGTGLAVLMIAGVVFGGVTGWTWAGREP